MLTFPEARQKIESLLVEKGKYVDGGVIVLEEHTITKPYGWVFFYGGRRFAETGDIKHGIAGNGPIVILARTGEAVSLGTARHPDEAIARFEQARGLVAT